MFRVSGRLGTQIYKPQKETTKASLQETENVALQHEFELFRLKNLQADERTVDTVEDVEPLHSLLNRAMQTLNLHNGDMVRLIGVDSENVDRWIDEKTLYSTCPAHIKSKIVSIVSISDMLRDNLLEGRASNVVRRPVELYGNRTMLELIEADQHEWLESDTKSIFNYSALA